MGGFFSPPKPKPLPPPPPPPPVPSAKESAEDIAAAKAEDRKRLARQSGRAGTIKTGILGDDDTAMGAGGGLATKKLLGG